MRRLLSRAFDQHVAGMYLLGMGSASDLLPSEPAPYSKLVVFGAAGWVLLLIVAGLAWVLSTWPYHSSDTEQILRVIGTFGFPLGIVATILTVSLFPWLERSKLAHVCWVPFAMIGLAVLALGSA